MSATSIDLAKSAPDKAVAMSGDIAELKRFADDNPAIDSALKDAFTAVMADRSLLGTKTFWVTLLTPVVGFVVSYYGLGLDGSTVGAITTVTGTAAAWVMRYVTKTPVASVLPTSSVAPVQGTTP